MLPLNEQAYNYLQKLILENHFCTSIPGNSCGFRQFPHGLYCGKINN